MDELRNVISDLRNKLSKTNEESNKLELNHLNNSILIKNRENEILTKENIILKGKLVEVQSHVERIIYEGQQFRCESNQHVII